MEFSHLVVKFLTHFSFILFTPSLNLHVYVCNKHSVIIVLTHIFHFFVELRSSCSQLYLWPLVLFKNFLPCSSMLIYIVTSSCSSVSRLL